MSKPIGLGFIGCGGHSERHADVVRMMPRDFKIVGAMDIDRDVAEKFILDEGSEAMATSDVNELLAIEGMDAVLNGRWMTRCSWIT